MIPVGGVLQRSGGGGPGAAHGSIGPDTEDGGDGAATAATGSGRRPSHTTRSTRPVATLSTTAAGLTANTAGQGRRSGRIPPGQVQCVVHGGHLPKQRRGWFGPSQHPPCLGNPHGVLDRSASFDCNLIINLVGRIQ